MILKKKSKNPKKRIKNEKKIEKRNDLNILRIQTEFQQYKGICSSATRPCDAVGI